MASNANPELPIKYVFDGIVHPERALCSISALKESHADGDTLIRTIFFSVELNRVTAIVECADDTTDSATLKNIVLSAVQTAVNIADFLSGTSHAVEVIKRVDDSGMPIIYGVSIPVLDVANRNRDEGLDFDRILGLCAGELGAFMRRCLNDLNLSMREAGDTPFYCYRALESLMQYFKHRDNVGEKNAWKVLRQVANKSETDFDRLKHRASGLRHGRPATVSDECRQTDFKFTWDVVEAFVRAESASTAQSPSPETNGEV